MGGALLLVRARDHGNIFPIVGAGGQVELRGLNSDSVVSNEKNHAKVGGRGHTRARQRWWSQEANKTRIRSGIT